VVTRHENFLILFLLNYYSRLVATILLYYSATLFALLVTGLTFYVPLDTQQVLSKMFPKPISWLGMEKRNLTQQKHTFINQKKCTTTK